MNRFLFDLVRKGTLSQQLRCVGSGIHTRLVNTSPSVHPWLALSSCFACRSHSLSALLKVPLLTVFYKRSLLHNNYFILQIEGILDGGHNTLAIGLFILKQALEYHGESLSSTSRNWDAFKSLWIENRDIQAISPTIDLLYQPKSLLHILYLECMILYII